MKVWCVCVLLAMVSLAPVLEAAPLPEKIVAPGLQRPDCLMPEDGADAEFAPYIEEFRFHDERAGITLYSCVNWQAGVVKSEGVGKKLSARAAEMVARGNALKTLLVLNVSADARLQQYLAAQKDVLLSIQNVLIKGAEAQELPVDPAAPDEARALVTIPFYGVSGLVSFFLDDEEIYLPDQGAFNSATGAEDENYTGILIDATALPLEPALFPQIVSETGEVLYAASQVAQEVLTERGMVEYVTERDDSLAWRAGANPLRVRPLLIASTAAHVPLPTIAPPGDGRNLVTATWPMLAEVKSRGGRGRSNALTVTASDAEGQQVVNVVVSAEDAEKIKQANADGQADEQGNYTVLIGREIGGVQGRLPSFTIHASR